MENSRIELIFPIFLVFLFIFASISQKIAYKMGPKFFSQIFIKSQLSRGGRLFKNSSIVDITFFEIEKIEKTTNLHYNLFICFILDHIHFFTGILLIRGRNEWIYGITFVNYHW